MIILIKCEYCDRAREVRFSHWFELGDYLRDIFDHIKTEHVHAIVEEHLLKLYVLS